jgi:hypothetical protein
MIVGLVNNQGRLREELFVAKTTIVNPNLEVGILNVVQDPVHVRLLDFTNFTKEKVSDHDRQSGQFVSGNK